MSTAAEQDRIAKLLLSRIPRSDRADVVQEAVHLLQQDSRPSEVGLAISLLVEHPDTKAREGILAHLHASLLNGDLHHAEVVCSLDHGLQRDALDRVIAQLATVANSHLESGNAYQAVRMEVLFDRSIKPAEVLSDCDRDSSMVSLLRFAGSAASSELGVHSLMELFRSTLILMGAADKQVCAAASATFVAVFIGPAAVTVDDELVWKCIQTLTSCTDDDFYPRLGFGLWLRWAACKDMAIHDWFDRGYWHSLRLGLQNGDTERRKQCLGILRRSVLDASEDPSLHDLGWQDTDVHNLQLYSDANTSAESQTIVENYDRFLTVFETIVLGRYLNQVVACAGDLDLLASPKSLVKSEWLYALLAASLGSSMQDSNRKWLGAWIMRSGFQPDASDNMLDFLGSAFLPWAMQGSLFTTTLKKKDGRMHCFHGQRLATYVEHLLNSNLTGASFTARLLDTVLNVLVARKSNSFAYAVIYVLEGIGHAMEHSPSLALDKTQMKKIMIFSSWSSVPEVARDYVFVRCLKIHHISQERSAPGEILNYASSGYVQDWRHLCQVLPSLNKNSMGGLGTPIVSIHLDKSSRDQQEQDTTLKCETLRTTLEHSSQVPSAAELDDALQDIWTDLEYLEYPKRLVTSMPGLTLHITVVSLAVHYEPLRSTIIRITLSLQSLSENRMHIFSPLVCSLRCAILSSTDVAAMMPLEDFIINYAQHLPECTIDFRLEDATTQILATVDSALDDYGYTYYFGDRENLGYAALLDLVSRIGKSQPNLLKGIFDGLLERWRRQKTPPPTVSPWKTALQLQIMLLCCEVVVPIASTADVQRIMNDLHYVLSIESLPRYRYLLVWMMARSYLSNNELRSQVLTELNSTDHHSNPKYLASLMKIAVMLARIDGTAEGFAVQVAAACVALAASSKVVIRHEAQWQVPLLMEHARAMSWQGIIGNPAFVALDNYIRSYERFNVPPPERLLDRLDPVNDHTLTYLAEGKWWGLDSIEAPLCGHSDFVELYKRDAAVEHVEWPASTIPLGPAVTHITTTQSDLVISDAKPTEASTGIELVNSTSSSRALQTKGTAYLQDLALQEDGPVRNDIIVVASLVDNPYNLGGLSRVSEIFGARELHLQNQNVVGNKDFTGVAVSSHLHFPIRQLSASALPVYLAEKKGEGYAVVGIEQTNRSLLLGSPDCVIPKKCILVIGSEKEGIPALVLGECDVLVEIPQQGVTRSLNVQTAAAIVLFEYARQHRMT